MLALVLGCLVLASCQRANNSVGTVASLCYRRDYVNALLLCESLLASRPDDADLIALRSRIIVEMDSHRERLANAVDSTTQTSDDSHSNTRRRTATYISATRAALATASAQEEAPRPNYLLAPPPPTSISAPAASTHRYSYMPADTTPKIDPHPTSTRLRQPSPETLPPAVPAPGFDAEIPEFLIEFHQNDEEPMEPPADDSELPRIQHYGFGVDWQLVEQLRQPASKTGRARSFLEEERPLRPAMLVGHSIPAQPGSVFYGYEPFPRFPTGPMETDQRRSVPFSCEDNIDNNGNGAVDKNDPACWAIPNDPRTYSYFLDEGVVDTSLTSPLALPVVPTSSPPSQ